MIEARGLVKRYGSTLAVDDLGFTVRPGLVTGFLGPNGAGKTTTMRLILGLDHATAGTVTVNGKPYRQLASPMREVGALLDAGAVHGGRTARNHLLCLAQANGIPARRVDEVLGIAGLSDVAGKRSKGFSPGMSQRLGIAAGRSRPRAPACGIPGRRPPAPRPNWRCAGSPRRGSATSPPPAVSGCTAWPSPGPRWSRRSWN
jgi:ABC-type multidrug transport system ATPase subunit